MLGIEPGGLGWPTKLDGRLAGPSQVEWLWASLGGYCEHGEVLLDGRRPRPWWGRPTRPPTTSISRRRSSRSVTFRHDSRRTAVGHGGGGAEGEAAVARRDRVMPSPDKPWPTSTGPQRQTTRPSRSSSLLPQIGNGQRRRRYRLAAHGHQAHHQRLAGLTRCEQPHALLRPPGTAPPRWRCVWRRHSRHRARRSASHPFPVEIPAIRLCDRSGRSPSSAPVSSRASSPSCTTVEPALAFRRPCNWYLTDLAIPRCARNAT